MNFIKKNLPLIIFHLIILSIILVNFPFGKLFIGWDSLNPEFNFFVNFRRAIFAGWQENYGVGLIGGHGFASTLPHTIITFFLSLILPLEAIRPFFTFLCLYLGGLGMFLLVKLLLNQIKESEENLRFGTWDFKFIDYIALFASLFYVLNLGTLQMFYVQLETFIVHFASLPLLFWIVIRILQKPSRKSLILFFLINFFSTLQGFIPSLFVAYFTTLLIFLAVFTFPAFKIDFNRLRKSIFIIIFTLVVNAYWFLPLGYYQVTRNSIFLNSYNNLVSTEHFIDVNKKYGDFKDVAIVKGYLFDSYELGEFVLQPWINHYKIPFVPAIAYSLFAIGVIGLLYALFFIKNWTAKAFCGIYLYFFLSLSTNTFPFSLITQLLQAVSPTYQQAFRTAFTKFSLGLTFSYSIAIGIGLFVLLNLLIKKGKNLKSIKTIFCLLFLLLFFYSLPTFRGNFLYKRLTVDMPKAYFDVFNFFKGKENARIADFPQDCSEGWFAYKWGYFGSGFYWYGLEQPVMARTFDVWSNYNENYYWEVSQALREQDYKKVDSIINKYNIKWVLFDPNFIFCRSQRSVFTSNDFLDYLKSSGNYSLVGIFEKDLSSPIHLFENKNYKTKNFVSIKENLSSVNQYKWSDTDIAYFDLGDYFNSKNPQTYFPFSNLFTKRVFDNKNPEINIQKDWIILNTNIPKNLENKIIKFNKYSSLENNVNVLIQIDSSSNIKATLKFPQVYIDGIQIANFDKEFNLGKLKGQDTQDLKVFVDGNLVKKNSENENTYSSSFYFSLPDKIEITGSNNSILLSWIGQENPFFQEAINSEFELILPTYQKGLLSVILPKSKNYLNSFSFSNFNQIAPSSCNNNDFSANNKYEIGNEANQGYMRLNSQDSSQCLFFHLNNLKTSEGYIFEIKNRRLNGNQLKFSISNKNRTIYNDEFFNSDSSFASFFAIVPPTFKNEIGFDVQFENISENYNPSINDFAGFSVWEIPYNFLKNLRIEDQTSATKSYDSSSSFSVDHPNETFYKISGNFKKNNYLILSQGFDNGWKAYEVDNNPLSSLFPFVFGKQIKNHVLVNNWENGWILDNPSKPEIILIFLPQYLEYFGFILLFGLIIWIVKIKIKTS